MNENDITEPKEGKDDDNENKWDAEASFVVMKFAAFSTSSSQEKGYDSKDEQDVEASFVVSKPTLSDGEEEVNSYAKELTLAMSTTKVKDYNENWIVDFRSQII